MSAFVCVICCQIFTDSYLIFDFVIGPNSEDLPNV
jgi:hypothetical protein